MDCNLPCSSVQGFSQARILEWVVISFSMRSSQPRDQTCVSCISRWFFTTRPPGKSGAAQNTGLLWKLKMIQNPSTLECFHWLHIAPSHHHSLSHFNQSPSFLLVPCLPSAQAALKTAARVVLLRNIMSLLFSKSSIGFLLTQGENHSLYNDLVANQNSHYVAFFFPLPYA